MNELNISETFCAYCKAIDDICEANSYIIEHRCERLYGIPLYCKAAIFDDEKDLENNEPNCTIISLPESIVKSSNPALFALEKFYKNIKRKEVE